MTAAVQVLGAAQKPPWDPAVRGNIYNGHFLGSFGQLVDSSVAALPGNTSWVLDATQGPYNTSRCMTEHINAGGSPNPFFRQISPAAGILYSRIAWKPSTPNFVNDGVKNFCDQVKVLRHLGANFGTQMGSLFVGVGSGSNGQLAFSWDQITGAPGNRTGNMNTPVPNLQTLLGTWIILEMVTDLRVNNAIRFQARMNGVQYFDYTDALSNVDTATTVAGVYGTFQCRGTINQNVPSTSASDEQIGEVMLDDFSRGFLPLPPR